MKKMNKKGFTLIELLAVIVILAIIMVIAIPQILNVIDSSRSSAWKDNIKMIEKSIELNTSLFNPETGSYSYTLEGLCSDTTKLSGIADIQDTGIRCSGNVFTLDGSGQFKDKRGGIKCTSSGCDSCSTEAECASPAKNITLQSKPTQ